MAINYDARPAGMSKREYAASVLGGSKDDYDSSGNKNSSSSSKSSSNSITYKPVTYKASDFVDTKSVSSAYDSAKSVFTDQLTALKPRYEELYKQLQASQDLAAEKEAALSGKEDTQQKVDLAKRGVSTDTGNQFYNTEAGKLEQQQNLRSKETALDYAGKRLDVAGAESADTRELSTSIANLDLTKATSIANMITDAKKTAATLNASESEKALQSAQWNKTFEYTQNKDAADRALELYKLSKNESTIKDNAYTSAKASLVTNAYSTNVKGDYSKPNQRENIIKQLQIAFPNISAEQIKNDVGAQMPNGWENDSFGQTVLKKGDDGETYIEY